MIATRVGGMPEVVAHGKTGLLVPPDNAPALAEAILDVLEHRDQYVRPREPIAEMFSPAKTAERYEAIFEDLLHSKRRR